MVFPDVVAAYTDVIDEHSISATRKDIQNRTLVHDILIIALW
jgi:hypothetical protein